MQLYYTCKQMYIHEVNKECTHVIINNFIITSTYSLIITLSTAACANPFLVLISWYGRIIYVLMMVYKGVGGGVTSEARGLTHFDLVLKISGNCIGAYLLTASLRAIDQIQKSRTYW